MGIGHGIAAIANPPDNDSWQDLNTSVLDLMASHRYREAWQVCEAALNEFPSNVQLVVNAGAILTHLGRPAEAELYMARAAALQPDSPVIWNNLGCCLRNLNRIPESIECFDHAIRLDPRRARAHYDRAFSLLLSGDYPNGFREYEHRWETYGMRRPGDRDPAMRARLWRGQDIAGKRLLVYAEQGLGDSIQFLRYIPVLESRGAHVILEMQPPLRGLAQWLNADCEVGTGNPFLEFDYHCPLMTLPCILGTTLESIPPPATFSVPDEACERWRAFVPRDGLKNVGIVWAGNPENPMDDRRSTELSTFQPLLKNERLRIFSFQVGPRARELSNFRGIVDLAPKLTAVTETAAALLQMDLIVTVDTLVAHLAASLGREVWILLAFAPDWRWLLEREDSPWYPTVRLFRQPSPGNWPAVSGALELISQRNSVVLQL